MPMMSENEKRGMGRMLSLDPSLRQVDSLGVIYHASWVNSTGTRCFQLMETPCLELLDAWVSHWDDLIDFEVVPVLTSTDFWAKTQLE